MNDSRALPGHRELTLVCCASEIPYSGFLSRGFNFCMRFAHMVLKCAFFNAQLILYDVIL